MNEEKKITFFLEDFLATWQKKNTKTKIGFQKHAIHTTKLEVRVIAKCLSIHRFDNEFSCVCVYYCYEVGEIRQGIDRIFCGAPSIRL